MMPDETGTYCKRSTPLSSEVNAFRVVAEGSRLPRCHHLRLAPRWVANGRGSEFELWFVGGFSWPPRIERLDEVVGTRKVLHAGMGRPSRVAHSRPGGDRLRLTPSQGPYRRHLGACQGYHDAALCRGRGWQKDGKLWEKSRVNCCQMLPSCDWSCN
jgi:hypothetical protein